MTDPTIMISEMTSHTFLDSELLNGIRDSYAYSYSYYYPYRYARGS